MPEKKNISILQKNTLLTLMLAVLFVIAYFLIIGYSYNSLVRIAEEDVSRSTLNAATSFEKILEADSTEMDYIAAELKSSDVDLTDSEDTDAMLEFLTGMKPEGNTSLAFIYEDLTYITSDGDKDVAEDFEDYKGRISDNDIFKDSATNEDNLVRRFRPITNGHGDVVGWLVGIYDYSRTLEECYSSTRSISNLHDIIFVKDGSIATCSNIKDSEFEKYDNLYTFLKEHEYSGKLPDTDHPIDSAETKTMVIDNVKYFISVVPITNVSGLFIAHTMPTSSMFANTGKIILFMVLASLLFFFILAIIAYRYYKSINATSNIIKEVAFADPLTGYPNYAKFKEDAEEILEHSIGTRYYLSCLDIVGFRYINDTFGYDTGDEILIAISKEIYDLLADDEVFCRISGDKFVLLTRRNFGDTENELFIYQLAERISSIPHLAKSHIRLEVQMGVYPIPENEKGHTSINALYDRALIALGSINHTDTGVAVYDSSIYNEQLERKEIESKMHQALTDGEFRVYVQPKYRTSNAKLAAGEALIRWIDPQKGIIPPIKFIPLFEQNRFVHDVDLYVMEVVARFQRMRLNEGLPVVPISLNISPVEFTMPGFCDAYINIKKKYDIPDKLIELEFTEGIFFENEALFKDIINTFHDAGFTCSMDDFGSGYSSLNILKDLPVDVLKLDKLFFRESENTSRDRSIIRSVVAMARSLNIKTVAEGVETLDAVDFLKLIGCTLIQGYIYSKPLPLTEFEEKLNNEEIDKDDDLELDFDKFEIVPLDMPLTNSIDDTLRKTYAGIIEINAGGNIYHMYYPGDKDIKFELIPERGFFSTLYEELIPKFVHPKDLETAKANMNPVTLAAHFKTNTELDFEYRHMRKDGTYSWMKLHIIKASGGRADSQIFFGYFNVIDDYKEAEESLSIAQNRLSAAYSNLNGAVFELDLPSGKVDMLETHSSMLAAVKDIHDYNQIFKFVYDLLIKDEYKEILETNCSLEHLRSHFTTSANQDSLDVEVLAKPSRKVSYYNFYRATFSAQADPNKLLITIEDITEQKKKDGASRLRHYITDVAFANTFESITIINIDKDLYTRAVYPPTGKRAANITEGRYSLFFRQYIDKYVKEEDKNTMEQIFSLDGLVNFYTDTSTDEFKFTYNERKNPESDVYEWQEALLVSAPEEFGQDRLIYLFKHSIEEVRTTEQNLNEYAHRLSYSLAMFDYVYSVDCDTQAVEVIGGRMFDGDIFYKEDVTYQEITGLVKNGIIAESDQAAFRRISYIDELLEYFATHPATLTRSFKSLESDNEVVEVTVIYGAREHKLTFFVRHLDKSVFNADAQDLNM